MVMSFIFIVMSLGSMSHAKPILHYVLGLHFGNLKRSKSKKKYNQLTFFPFFLALGNFRVFFAHFHLHFGYQHVGENAR